MADAAKLKLPSRPGSVLLELSKEEAETLQLVLYRVGGTPETTRRKHADAIIKALRHHAGVSPEHDTAHEISNGSINFIK